MSNMSEETTRHGDHYMPTASGLPTDLFAPIVWGDEETETCEDAPASQREDCPSEPHDHTPDDDITVLETCRAEQPPDV